MRRHSAIGELLLVGVLGLALVGCSEPKRTPPSASAAPSAKAAAVSPSQTQASPAPKSARKAEPPGPGDRDPFNRPKGVKPPVAAIDCQGKVVLRDHAISELQLTGVVVGATQAAMLRVGSSGVSGVVHRGERLGKSCSRVKAIHRDRIVLELRRKVDDKSTSAEQVLKLTRKAG